jgi:hypothetical protein
MNRRRVRTAVVVCLVALAVRAGDAADSADAAVPVDRDIDFVSHIVPILTRHGCNSGGCHGAGAGTGQNGFYLSLFGFEPVKDHERIVGVARGRYLEFAAPDESLLLLKPSGASPHGGGIRLPPDSASYATLRRWIAAGAPLGDPGRYPLRTLEIAPATRILQPREQVRLKVTAVYADGDREDVTATCRFESNDSGVAEVDKEGTGLVTAGDLPGDVAIVVSYREQRGFVSLTIPRPGRSAAEFPPASNFIDEHTFAKMRQMGVSPAPTADDGAFLRRLMIDVGGRVPTAEEAAEFLADPSADKRAVWIDRILDSGDYATNFADKWVVLLRSNREVAGFGATVAMHQWLRQSFQDNVPYDRFVSDLLTASGATGENPAVGWWRSQQSLNNKDFANNPGERVKDAAEDSALLFLGQRIACAKCHQHPFDRWSQADYHGYAAYFARVQLKPAVGLGSMRLVHGRGEARIQHPSTGESLGPKPLAGPVAEVPADEDPRQRLAAWVTSPDNPYFAKAIVNRMWAHFFGRGFVDPEDDLRETNPPSNPALLEALAADFVAHKFDLRHLVRTICRSATYQRASTPDDSNRDDLRNYSRHLPRRLKAEVLLDAIDALAGTRTSYKDVPTARRAMELPDDRSATAFLETFGRSRTAAACECGRNTASPSLGQSLQLINAAEIQGKLGASGGRAKEFAEDKSRSLESRIEALFLAAYARQPTAAEIGEVRSYLDEKQQSVAAWEDLIWVLINSKEFLFTR